MALTHPLHQGAPDAPEYQTSWDQTPRDHVGAGIAI
jgi:hypothetical protein